MKITNFYLVLSVLVSVGLCACNEIKVEDGVLAEKYVPYVDPYLGSYQGEVEGKKTEIQIVMRDNAPVLKVKNELHGDITGKGCRSNTGRLLSFTAADVGGHNYQLDKARFALDASSCGIKGRVVTLKFDGKSKFQLAISSEDNRKSRCVGEVCHKVGELDSIKGHFSKN